MLRVTHGSRLAIPCRRRYVGPSNYPFWAQRCHVLACLEGGVLSSDLDRYIVPVRWQFRVTCTGLLPHGLQIQTLRRFASQAALCAADSSSKYMASPPPWLTRDISWSTKQVAALDPTDSRAWQAFLHALLAADAPETAVAIASGPAHALLPGSCHYLNRLIRDLYADQQFASLLALRHHLFTDFHYLYIQLDLRPIFAISLHEPAFALSDTINDFCCWRGHIDTQPQVGPLRSHPLQDEIGNTAYESIIDDLVATIADQALSIDMDGSAFWARLGRKRSLLLHTFAHTTISSTRPSLLPDIPLIPSVLSLPTDSKEPCLPPSDRSVKPAAHAYCEIPDPTLYGNSLLKRIIIRCLRQTGTSSIPQPRRYHRTLGLMMDYYYAFGPLDTWVLLMAFSHLITSYSYAWAYSLMQELCNLKLTQTSAARDEACHNAHTANPLEMPRCSSNETQQDVLALLMALPLQLAPFYPDPAAFHRHEAYVAGLLLSIRYAPNPSNPTHSCRVGGPNALHLPYPTDKATQLQDEIIKMTRQVLSTHRTSLLAHLPLASDHAALVSRLVRAAWSPMNWQMVYGLCHQWVVSCNAVHSDTSRPTSMAQCFPWVAGCLGVMGNDPADTPITSLAPALAYFQLPSRLVFPRWFYHQAIEACLAQSHFAIAAQYFSQIQAHNPKGSTAITEQLFKALVAHNQVHLMADLCRKSKRVVVLQLALNVLTNGLATRPMLPTHNVQDAHPAMARPKDHTHLVAVEALYRFICRIYPVPSTVNCNHEPDLPFQHTLTHRQRDTLYNRTIHQLIHYKQHRAARIMHYFMAQRGITPQLPTFNYLLKYLFMVEPFGLVYQCYRDTVDRWLQPNRFTASIVLHGIARSGSHTSFDNKLSRIAGSIHNTRDACINQATSTRSPASRVAPESPALSESELRAIFGLPQTSEDVGSIHLNEPVPPNWVPHLAQSTGDQGMAAMGTMARELSAQIFHDLQQANVPLDTTLFTNLFRYLTALGEPLAQVWGLFEDMQQFQVTPDAATYEALLWGLARHGQPEDARALFQHMSTTLPKPPGQTHYCALMHAYSRSQQPVQVLQLWRMLGQAFPECSLRAINIFLLAMIRAQEFQTAIDEFYALCARHPTTMSTKFPFVPITPVANQDDVPGAHAAAHWWFDQAAQARVQQRRSLPVTLHDNEHTAALLIRAHLMVRDFQRAWQIFTYRTLQSPTNRSYVLEAFLQFFLDQRDIEGCRAVLSLIQRESVKDVLWRHYMSLLRLAVIHVNRPQYTVLFYVMLRQSYLDHFAPLDTAQQRYSARWLCYWFPTLWQRLLRLAEAPVDKAISRLNDQTLELSTWAIVDKPFVRVENQAVGAGVGPNFAATTQPMAQFMLPLTLSLQVIEALLIAGQPELALAALYDVLIVTGDGQAGTSSVLFAQLMASLRVIQGKEANTINLFGDLIIYDRARGEITGNLTSAFLTQIETDEYLTLLDFAKYPGILFGFNQTHFPTLNPGVRNIAFVDYDELGRNPAVYSPLRSSNIILALVYSNTHANAYKTIKSVTLVTAVDIDADTGAQLKNLLAALESQKYTHSTAGLMEWARGSPIFGLNETARQTMRAFSPSENTFIALNLRSLTSDVKGSNSSATPYIVMGIVVAAVILVTVVGK
ncbi:hypothetical protein H4R35_003156 [Dimargaris xerosporica]|nr:hypothetical protein H4R35_003156 [Dimargaris xerosporica]